MTIITDLSNRVLQQEQLLLDTQARLDSEQRKLTEATWRQVQFVVDVLVDQLQEEGLGDTPQRSIRASGGLAQRHRGGNVLARN